MKETMQAFNCKLHPPLYITIFNQEYSQNISLKNYYYVKVYIKTLPKIGMKILKFSKIIKYE
jgi:hypothetical protein